jgi:hypothetical protein
VDNAPRVGAGTVPGISTFDSDDPRAGRLEQLREEINHTHSGPVIEIPRDLDLRAEIDAGTYTLNRVRRRSTTTSCADCA